MREVIEENIEHLATVARHIIDKAPHRLGNVEAAANQLGYFFSEDGWKKRAEPAPAIAVEPLNTGDTAHTSAEPASPRATIKLKPKAEQQAPAQDGPVVKVKKTRIVSMLDDEPTRAHQKVAWPFPTTVIGN